MAIYASMKQPKGNNIIASDHGMLFPVAPFIANMD